MLSIVVPLFNEKESLPILYKNISVAMESIKEHYEIIFIDDGSTDRSLEILKELGKRDENVKIFSFRKNQGKAEALNIGFQKARGDYIITLDADLQDNPSEIRMFLDKLYEGWDLVCGWRKDRKDSFPKIIASRIFNLLVSLFWGIKLHDYNCGLKAYTKDVAKSLTLYGGLHRFIPLLAYQIGFRVSELVVIHEKRKFGKSKYGLSKVWKDLPDIFTMLFLARYSKRPLHFFGSVGGILMFIGFIILSYLSILRIAGEKIGNRPLLMFGILFFLAGLQIFFTGFLADLIISNSKSIDKGKILLKYESEPKSKEKEI